MKSYLVKTPKSVQVLFPKRIWTFPASNNKVYLTFDDGPVPEVTPWVLDELKKHNARATFFCIGDNINKHPELFRRIISEGHALGNHTYNHLNGGKTKTDIYVENVLKAEEEMNRTKVGSRKLEIEGYETQSTEREEHYYSKLFRPPYGKITSKQAKILQDKGYRIVMWDVLSADFDPDISEEKCFQNVSYSIKSGSIVVFHDSLKAERNLRYVLPRILNLSSEFTFEKISIE